MIEARELRIGNSILIDGVTPGTIKELRETHAKVLYKGDVNGNIGDRMSPINYDRIKPIPLTEEEVEKFGFNSKFKSVHTVWNIGNFYLHQAPTEDDFGGSLPVTQVFHYDFMFEIKWVHQLQNIFYALKGEELVKK